MISKLATWGSTRPEAIARMKRALREYQVGGIRTTIPFFEAVMQDEEFQRGEIDTGYLARFLERAHQTPAPDGRQDGRDEETAAAAIVAALDFVRSSARAAASGGAERPGEHSGTRLGERPSRWKTAGRWAAFNRPR
jgi:acetyl-CoA carboxylase biotin carboxylase subunit